MKIRFPLLIAVFCFFNSLHAQETAKRLELAMNQLMREAAFEHAIFGIYVADASTGKTVFEMNSNAGLAPASCQKIITSVAAFEILGKDFRYSTDFYLSKKGNNSYLGIDASGDPTFGSNRWVFTSAGNIYKKLQKALSEKQVQQLMPAIEINAGNFSYQPVPDGWVWQDIGNYYGAGAFAFNWNENKFDWILEAGKKPGDTVTIKGFDPDNSHINTRCLIRTGEKGSGDNAYIYSSPYNNNYFATGTIPAGQTKFTVKASMHDPADFFARELLLRLEANGLISESNRLTGSPVRYSSDKQTGELIAGFQSPSLDSINYWFLKKSINLYGEAIVKTMGAKIKNTASTDSGVAVIRSFWAGKGIEKSSMKIIDGSGLSPANRVTAKALVNVLQYAKKQSWFSSFYNALPEMNGMKMKDGYIGGVRSYAGYSKSNAGKEYVFSFIVNNFDGDPSAAREKIWAVLDLLK